VFAGKPALACQRRAWYRWAMSDTQKLLLAALAVLLLGLYVGTRPPEPPRSAAEIQWSHTPEGREFTRKSIPAIIRPDKP